LKLAAVFLAPLVALLIALPAPAVAAPLPSVQQTDQNDEAPATPAPAVEEVNPIVDLHATAGRLRGRVELGWNFVTPEPGGEDTADTADWKGSVFVVERSTNGSSWRPVKGCYLSLDAAATAYACTDVRLASGTTYAYRVCLASKPATCSNALTAGPVLVKAP
jgi:hypothetical protein